MPPASEHALLDHLLRTLIYGPSKARKTTWVLQAAKAGFNVIFVDADDGAHVLRSQVTAAMRERIHVIDAVDLLDHAVAIRFATLLLKKDSTFVWDEQDKVQKSTRAGIDPAHSHYYFDARKLTSNDILFFDSWTALAQSTGWNFADEKDIDVTEIKRDQDNMWPGFEYQGRHLDFILKNMHGVPCHVVVAGHSYEYEKWDRRDKKNPKLLWTKTLPISSSGPHSMKLAKSFSDVLYFDRLSEVRTMIDTGGSQDRDGGSRFLPPKKYRWDDRVVVAKTPEEQELLSIQRLLYIAGFQGDASKPCAGVKWFPPGVNPYGEAPQKTQVSLGTQQSGQFPAQTGPNGNGAVPASPVADPNTAKPEPPQPIGRGSSLVERIRMKAQSESEAKS